MMKVCAMIALVPLALQAQEVRLRIGGNVGQANRYEGTMETWMRGGPMAAMATDTTLPMSRMTTWSTRTLTAINGDTMVFTEVIDSARSESPAMPQMQQMMAGATAMMRGMTSVMRMNARGKVLGIEVQGGPQAGGPGGPGGRGPGRGGMMGGGQQSARPTFGLPERAVRAGDTWTDSSTTTESGSTSTMVATYRVESVGSRGGARIAVIAMTGNVVRQSPQGGSTMALTGQITFDATNGRATAFTMDMNGTMSSQRGDIPMRMLMAQRLI